jgi:hypothetical protein
MFLLYNSNILRCHLSLAALLLDLPSSPLVSPHYPKYLQIMDAIVSLISQYRFLMLLEGSYLLLVLFQLLSFPDPFLFLLLMVPVYLYQSFPLVRHLDRHSVFPFIFHYLTLRTSVHATLKLVPPILSIALPSYLLLGDF